MKKTANARWAPAARKEMDLEKEVWDRFEGSVGCRVSRVLQELACRARTTPYDPRNSLPSST